MHTFVYAVCICARALMLVRVRARARVRVRPCAGALSSVRACGFVHACVGASRTYLGLAPFAQVKEATLALEEWAIDARQAIVSSRRLVGGGHPKHVVLLQSPCFDVRLRKHVVLSLLLVAMAQHYQIDAVSIFRFPGGRREDLAVPGAPRGYERHRCFSCYYLSIYRSIYLSTYFVGRISRGCVALAAPRAAHSPAKRSSRAAVRTRPHCLPVSAWR